MKPLIGILTFFILNTAAATEHFDFLNDYLEVNKLMNTASLEFKAVVGQETNIETLKKAINEYNNTIVLQSLNLLVKHTKSDDTGIKKLAVDLSNLLSDLVRNNYEYLAFISNGKATKDAIKKRGEELIRKNEFASQFFNEMTLGILAEIVKERPAEGSKDAMYLKITRSEKASLEEKIRSAYGNTVKRGLQATLKDKNSTAFEQSSVMIYDFFQIKNEWVFEN